MINPLPENSCRILLESLNQVLFTLDNQGKITFISGSCTELTGYLPEEMTGRPISAFVIPEDKGRVGNICGQANPGKTHPLPFRIVGKEGGFYQAMAVSRSGVDGQDENGMIGMIGEISFGKQTEKIIRQANTRIHILNSIVRHDINNQLTVLNGYLSLMEQDDGTLESVEVVGILLDATEKIHNLANFTTAYKDLGTHSPVWTNLYEAFHAARLGIAAHGVQITAESASRDIELFTDQTFTRVFHTLIENSLRHGKTVSELSLQWRADNGRAIIVYEDNGCGIPETVRPTLFQPGKQKKTGYGLFLVHEILAISGFTITETGTTGKGVRFEISVPAGSFRVAQKNNQSP